MIRTTTSLSTAVRRAVCFSLFIVHFSHLSFAQEDLASEVLNPGQFVRSGSTFNLGLITSCFDSYLSPNNYMGLEVSALGESWHRSSKNDRLFLQSLYDTSVGLTEGGSNSIAFVANEVLSDAWAWRIARLGIVDFYAGPEWQGRFGMVYNTRNSNNPANMKLGLHLGGMAMAEVRYRILHIPVRTSYQWDLPVVGAVFSPQYSQSYYEIFTLKHYAGTIHFVSPFNGFSLRRILTTDLTLRNSIIRLTMESDSYQYRTSTNNYAYRSFRLGVGFVFNSYSISPREKAYNYLPY